MERPRTKRWKCFILKPNATAKCEVCKKVYPFADGSTAILRKHLERKHPILNEQLNAIEVLCPLSELEGDPEEEHYVLTASECRGLYVVNSPHRKKKTSKVQKRDFGTQTKEQPNVCKEPLPVNEVTKEINLPIRKRISNEANKNIANPEEKTVPVHPSVNFGKYVGSKHKQYNKQTQNAVERLICDILFNADKGMYDAPVNQESSINTRASPIPPPSDKEIILTAIKEERSMVSQKGLIEITLGGWPDQRIFSPGQDTQVKA